MTNDIKITIDLRDGSTSLKAYAHLTFPTPFCEITINRFKVFEKDDGELWVALPSESFLKEDKRIFIPIIDIPKHMKRELGERIISEYKNKINDLCQS
jgi:DNA-binding cell septation regulator SpoVG